MRYGDIPGVGRCSRLVLGTMAFSPDRMEQASGLLDLFLALGGNTLDTAHNYGGEWEGRSERAIGRWLAERGTRDRVIIVDKGAHPDQHGPRVRPETIASDLADSLERLGTDHIDLYLLHRDDPAVPVSVIMEALNEHVRAGRVRALGASNCTEARIDEANAYAAAHRLQPFVASSTNLSLARAAEPRWPGCISLDAAGRAWHERRQFPLLSWSSQASGFFAGRFEPGAFGDPGLARVYDHADNWERLRRARELAARRGVDATKIAVAFVLDQPFPAFALIGPLTEAELRDSADVDGVTLSPEERAWLNLEA